VLKLPRVNPETANPDRDAIKYKTFDMEKVKYLKELEAQGLPAITQDPKKKQTNIYFDTEMSEIGEN
jgi:hypothetical protein